MGFLSKAFKGIKKAFKKIGKGIKSVFKKIGKFMGKIGFVGQLAMSFILPGIGGALMKGAGNIFKGVTGALAKGGKLAQTVGKVLEAGHKFAKAGTSAFRTVTDGVTSFVSEFGKTALKKIPGMEQMFPKLGNAADNFFVKDANGVSAWNTVQTGIEKNINLISKSFTEGVDALGGIKKIYTAEGANLGQQAVDITGKGTIPGVKGRIGVEQKSLLSDPNAPTPTAGPLREGYKFPDTTQGIDIKNLDLGMKGPQDLAKTFDVKLGEQIPTGSISTIDNASMTAGEFGRGSSGFFDKTQPTVDSTVDSDSFFDKAGDYVKEKYEKFLDGRSLGKAAFEETGEFVGTKIVEGVGSGVKQVGYDAVIGEEEAPETYNTGFVAPYQQVGIQDYASPQINDRAMQMAIDPQAYLQSHVYGVGANIYQNQMAIGMAAGRTV